MVLWCCCSHELSRRILGGGFIRSRSGCSSSSSHHDTHQASSIAEPTPAHAPPLPATSPLLLPQSQSPPTLSDRDFNDSRTPHELPSFSFKPSGLPTSFRPLATSSSSVPAALSRVGKFFDRDLPASCGALERELTFVKLQSSEQASTNLLL